MAGKLSKHCFTVSHFCSSLSLGSMPNYKETELVCVSVSFITCTLKETKAPVTTTGNTKMVAGRTGLGLCCSEFPEATFRFLVIVMGLI